MTKERPILFSGAMVRAILDGRKTQTRRVVKVQPPEVTREVFTFHHPDPRIHYWAFDGASLLDWAYPCPYGELGNRLYVRETWQHSNHPFGPYEPDCLTFYRADYLDDPLGPDLERAADGIIRQWRPSIHMPRSASRILLEITSVRVERLNDCSQADAIAEGIHPYKDGGERFHADPADTTHTGATKDPRLAYKGLWEQINGAGTWAGNPWVWVVEFQRAA